MNVEKVRELIRSRPSISQSEIASNLGLDPVTVRTIVNDFLHLGQINHRWTPTTLTSAQRIQRLDWSNFVLEKSKHPDCFTARFDTWIYKDNDHWTFDSNTNFKEKRVIACFYTITGIRAVASVSDPRLLASPNILDNCLGHDVNEKRFLYVDSSAYNSARLLDCLHDRGVVLVPLPECSPDLMLGETLLEPTFWSNLQRRRFDKHDEGLKEYKNCIGKAVGGMGSKMFERWFERIQRCVKSEGDYVEQIRSSGRELTGRGCRQVEARASTTTRQQWPEGSSEKRKLRLGKDTPPTLQWGVSCPKSPRGGTGSADGNTIQYNESFDHRCCDVNSSDRSGPCTEESTSGNVATMDGGFEWQLEELNIEPKEENYEYTAKVNDNEQPNVELATASIGSRNSGSSVQARVVSRRRQRRARRRQRQAAASPVEDSASGADVVSTAGARNEADAPLNSERDRNDKKDYPKPGYSYACLCALAIKNSRNGALPVTAIYRFMCEHFPYFKTAAKCWKNSIRHNLSHNASFEKINTRAVQPNKRSNFWIVDPLKAEKMEWELQQKTKRHLKNLREAMSQPEKLELLVRGEVKFVNDFSDDSKDSSDDLEIHNAMALASQLEASSASDDGSSESQDDEVDIVDDDNEAPRVQPHDVSEYVPVSVAKRQKTLAGTMQPVYVYLPAKGRKLPLIYRADPLLEMI